MTAYEKALKAAVEKDLKKIAQRLEASIDNPEFKLKVRELFEDYMLFGDKLDAAINERGA
jgi:hypothetical protein